MAGSAHQHIAVAIRSLQHGGGDRAIQRAMWWMRCASWKRDRRYFADDASVFTLSIHQFNNYPTEKPLPAGHHLPDGVCDESICTGWAMDIAPR